MTAAYKRYFRTHLQSALRPLIYITAIVLVITLVTALNGQITTVTYVDPPKTYYNSNLGTPAWMLILLCYAAPIMEFATFKKRTNLDCLYSMPLSRRELGTVHYLTGAITVSVPYTLSYLLNALLLLRAPEQYDFAPLVGFYFLSLLFGLCVYSLFVFLIDRANALGDGIAFMTLWGVVFFFAALALCEILPSQQSWSINPLPGFIWLLMLTMTSYYGATVEKSTSDFYTISSLWRESDVVFWFIFWVVLGVAAAIGFFLLFGKKRTEKTGEVSDTFFGYRVLIPLLAACGMLSIGNVWGWVLFEVLAFIGYTVYRRGFHYKKSDIIVLAALSVFLFLFLLG